MTALSEPETIPTEPCEHCVAGRKPLPPYTVEQLRTAMDAAARVPTPGMARRLARIEAGRPARRERA